MKWYADFRNPRTEINQKKLFRKKKLFMDFRYPKLPKNQFCA